MSQTPTLKDQCIAEFLGIGLLTLSGADCATALKVTGATFGQWEISVIWGLGAAMAIYLTTGVFGAHPNPAVTIALWLLACFNKREVAPFIISQIAGALYAAALVYGSYYNLFFDFEQANHIVCGSTEGLGLAGTFLTYLNPYVNFVQAFTVEMIITAILMELILALTDDGNDISRGLLALLLIGLLAAVIGAPMGSLTDLAMNPARDFRPKFSAWMVGWDETVFTGGRDVPYFLVPVSGPITGVISSAWVYCKLIGRYLPCDIHAIEEEGIAANIQQKASQ